jgi:NADPH-dependent glutamate synthase beta subunit-like oxidoreductase
VGIESAEALELLKRSSTSSFSARSGRDAAARHSRRRQQRRDECARIDRRRLQDRRIRELHGTVVVVGAGNTAIDAANAARRLGAETVYLLYRRGENDMSAFDFEYEHAKQEGVQFLWRASRSPFAEMRTAC